MIKNIGVGVVINDSDHPGHKVNGWIDGWTELIFHADTNSGKLRITWMTVVKNGHETLISINGI